MSGSATGRSSRRRTQEERSATTQAALLDATIECLVEYGYAGVTTTRVVERAGLSRGAQVHHFPTKAALVTAALNRLAQRRAQEIQHQLDALPAGPMRLDAVLDLLWMVHSGPLFEAALELWVAARTDSELRTRLLEVERAINDQIIRNAGRVFEGYADTSSFAANLELALAAMRGLALLRSLTPGDDPGSSARWDVLRRRLRTMFDAE